jgi:phage tail-like protein
MPQRGEPTVSFRLKVGESDWAFQEISGLDSESEVLEHLEGEPLRLPGKLKWSNIELKRGLDVDKGLWEWRKQVIDGNVRRADGTIEVIAPKGDQIAVYSIKSAWPSKYTVAAMSQASGSAFESITIAHEGIERIK